MNACPLGWKLSDLPKHPNLSSVKRPANLTVFPKLLCRRCPQCANHVTYRRGKLTSALDESYLPKTPQARHMQWCVHTFNYLWIGLYGSALGFPFSAAGGGNFVDRITMIVDAVDGATVTAHLADGSDPRSVSFGQSRYMPEDNVYWTWTAIVSSIMPEDHFLVDSPSCLATKCLPTIVRILDVWLSDDVWTMKFEADQDLTELMWTGDEMTPNPAQYTITVLKQSVPEAWFNVVDVAYHLVSRRSVWIRAEEVPADGRVLLAETAIAVPRVLPYPPTFKARASLADGTREDWGTQLADRIQVEQVGPGTWRTWLCLKTTDWKEETREDWQDLTANLSAVRVTYYPTATEEELEANRFKIAPTGNRCAHCIRLACGSDFKSPDGTALDGSGRRHVCSVRRYKTTVLVQGPGGNMLEQVTWHSPTGVTTFQADCFQPGTCDRFADINSAAVGERPFSIVHGWSRFFREIWASVSVKLVQAMAGTNYYFEERVRHPSIRSLLGGWPMSTPAGMHETSLIQEWCSGIGQCTTATDEAGNTRIVFEKQGYGFQVGFDRATIDVDDPQTYPPAGDLATNVEDWQDDHHDRLEYNRAVTVDEDPGRSMRVHEDRMGLLLEMDRGDQIGRTQVHYDHGVLASEALFCEDLNIGVVDEWIDRGDVKWKQLSAPVVIDGVSYSAVLQVTKVITHDRTARTDAVTGRVVSASNVADHIWEIVIQNAPNYWSFIDGPTGNRFDNVMRIDTGGHFCQPDDWQKINSYYATDKGFGSTYHRCCRGDAIRFPGVTQELEGVTGFSEKRFVVIATKAFDPDHEAPAWGNRHLIRSGLTTGYFQPALSALRKDQNGDGSVDSDDRDTVFGDPADDYYFHSYPETVQLTVRSDIDWDDTEIPLMGSTVLAMSIADNTFWLNLRTGEYVLVTAKSDLEGIPQLTVVRGRCESPAEDMQAGDVLEMQMVTVLLDGGADGIAFAQTPGDARPASIATGHFWVDHETGRMFFAEANKGQGDIALYWHTHTQPHGPAWVHSETGYTIAHSVSDGYETNSAVVKTDLSYSDWAGQVPDHCVVMTDTTIFAFTETLTPGAGQYAIVQSADDCIVFLFHLDNACRSMRIDLDTELEFAAPPDCAFAPESCTGKAWLKREDTVRVIDESDTFLRLYLELLSGADIACDYSSAVFMPDLTEAPKLGWYVRGENEVTNFDNADLLSEHGRGVFLIRTTAMVELTAALAARGSARFCVRFH